VVDARDRTPELAGAETAGRHAGAAIASGPCWIPEHSRRHLYRFENDPVSVQPWTELLSTFVPTINRRSSPPPYEDNPANGAIYPSYVPKTDKDGNDIAGIRLPELIVPLATYTVGDLGPGSGRTMDARPPANTSRLPQPRRPARPPAIRSFSPERYPSYGLYRTKLILAVDKLVRDRFLMCEDTQDMMPGCCRPDSPRAFRRPPRTRPRRLLIRPRMPGTHAASLPLYLLLRP